jgi:hypothetical protein
MDKFQKEELQGLLIIILGMIILLLILLNL